MANHNNNSDKKMAFFDDPKVLTAHLRHSFITSDDTGERLLLLCSVVVASLSVLCLLAYRTCHSIR